MPGHHQWVRWCRGVEYLGSRNTMKIIFTKLNAELQPDLSGIRFLCATRWTVCAESLGNVIDNYQVLIDLWDECLNYVKEPDIKAKIIGVQEQIINFFFGVAFGRLVLKHADYVGKTLQKPNLSAAVAQVAYI